MNRIWIFGGANIDIIGSSINNLIAHDSNIGKINENFGGVGRNIAEACMSMLEEPSYLLESTPDYDSASATASASNTSSVLYKESRVKFITCFSNDPNGKILRQDCEELGLDLSFSKITDNYPTSTYLAILDTTGEMHIAMSDMRILREMDPELVEGALCNVLPGDYIFFDSNMREDDLRTITEHVYRINSDSSCKEKIRIASDPVSISKIHRIKDYIPSISIFKPNKIEAEALTGIEITDELSAQKNLRWFLNRGVEEIIISMARQGVLLGLEDSLYWFKHRTIEMTSANGGGDAFTGAYLAERMNGVSPVEAIEFAISMGK